MASTGLIDVPLDGLVTPPRKPNAVIGRSEIFSAHKNHRGRSSSSSLDLSSPVPELSSLTPDGRRASPTLSLSPLAGKNGPKDSTEAVDDADGGAAGLSDNPQADDDDPNDQIVVKPENAASGAPTPGSAYRTLRSVVDFHIVTRDPFVRVQVKLSWADTPEATWELESRIHAVAPDTLFKFWDRKGGRSAALSIDEQDSATTYEVLAIRSHKRIRDRTVRPSRLFRVEWVGYPEMTWEKASVLPKGLLREYCETEGLVPRW